MMLKKCYDKPVEATKKAGREELPHTPRPYAGEAPPTQQCITVPSPHYTQNHAPFQEGICVCIYAVWDYYVPRRFLLFVSAGNSSAGRGL